MKKTYPHDDKDFPASKLWKAILFFLEGQEKAFLFWFGVLFLVFFWSVIPPLIIARIIDTLTLGVDAVSLQGVIGLIVLLGTAHGVVSLIRLTAKNKLGDLSAEAVYQVRVKGFERLVDFSLRWHDEENTGNKVQKIQSGAQALRDMREMMSQTGIQTITQVIGISMIFLFLNPFFIVFLVVYLGIFFAIHLMFYGAIQKMNDEFNKSQEAATGTYYEGVNNILTIKTLGVKDTFKSTVFANELITKNFNFKMRSVGINKWKIFQGFNAFSMIVYLSYVVWGVTTGAVSIGQIILFYTYLNGLMDAAANSTEIFDRYIQNKSAIARMMPIYWDTTSPKNGTLPFPTDWKTMKIDGGSVQFATEKKKPSSTRLALQNLSVTMRRNEKIGIAGLSGGGKSTFAKVMLGLYPLTRGRYAVDGVDFYSIDEREIMKHMTLVLQESEMFNMSIRDNISLLRTVDAALFRQAIEIAQLESLIAKLPLGLDTVIGEKGHRLSGGERQRIGIARAICKDTEVLIFDESTSALDSRTETLVQNALEKELHEKTIITIAHRITTLRNTDRILVFDKGTIAEEGMYQSLLSDENSLFSRIYKTQQKKRVSVT